MTTDRQATEQKAQALLKFALGNHNAKRYGEATGFYEVILERYPDTEAAQYARKNLDGLVNKIDGLAAVRPDELLIARIEQADPASPGAEPVGAAQRAPTPPADIAAAVPASRSSDKPAWKRLRVTENPYLLAGLFFLTAAVSYFIGREHVKYEIRQAFLGAAEGFRQGMTEAMAPLGTLGQGSAPAPAASEQDVDRPAVLTFPVTLNNKVLRKSDYTEQIDFTLTIDNALDRPITAFEGRILFKDVLGKLVLGVGMSYRDGITAKGRAVWSGTMRYNQFMREHQEFINLGQNQIVPELVIYKVAYQDGTIEEFPRP